MKKVPAATAPPPPLERSSCAARQKRLREALESMKLDAALILDPRHVQYFSAYWAPMFPGALYVPVDGESVLALPTDPEDGLFYENVVRFDGNRLATLVEDLTTAAVQALADSLRPHRRVGWDEHARPWLLSGIEAHDLRPTLLALRRRKDADELELLRRAVHAAEATYARAQEILAPGITEMELYGEMHRAAIRAVGEPIGPFGNDFQCASPGGPPRHRGASAGELAVLDIGVTVRGYRSDLCRTFCVGGEPSQAQREAHACVVAALEYVEATVQPGYSCRQLYEEVHALLGKADAAWEFFHHLGHGIGLDPHEAPRLNPHWNDVFETGDVFTAEPGLYGAGLKAGIRLEQNYLVKASGIERLSSYPLGL